MPGRGTETTTIKWCNTRHVMRNIFIHDGRLVIITEYTKARYKTNKSLYIARFLHPLVSRILFKYLAYVQPFIETLKDQTKLVSNKAVSLDQRSFTFSSVAGKPLSSYQLSAMISNQSIKPIGVSLTIASYRQTTIVIAKQHIVTIAKPFNPYSTTDINDPLLAIARQAGHNIRTLMASYAINKAYPTRLQPELLCQYEYISALWHKWLLLDELERKCKERYSAYQWQPNQQQKQKQKRKFDGQCLQAASNKRPATTKAAEVSMVEMAAQLPTPPPTSLIATAGPSPSQVQVQMRLSVSLEGSLDHSISGSDSAAAKCCTESLSPLLSVQSRFSELELRGILEANPWR